MQLSQEPLLEDALNIYKEIEDEPFSEEDKAIASIFLACDKNSCAVIRKLPKPNYKILKKARKKTKIQPNLEAINWVDSICELFNGEEDVSIAAKDILEKYKERCPKNYYGRPPLTTAVSAVYIASILCDKHIPQYELEKLSGITVQTIRKRYREILEKLPDVIDTRFFRYL